MSENMSDENIPSPKQEKKRCPNCQRKLKKSFKYCPKCGQRNTTHQISLQILMIDFLREQLHLNNKTLRSLKLLFLRPGEITKEYIKGRKKSLHTPTKLFTWTGFLMIAMLLPIVNNQHFDTQNGPIQFDLGGVSEESQINSDTPRGFIGSYFLEMVQEANNNPKLFAQKIVKRIPFVLMAVLPFFALLLKLFYWKRKLYYLEHLVFLLHFHSFIFSLVFLFLVVILLIPSVSSMISLIFAVVFLYFLLAYKTVYQHSWGGTLLRGTLVSCLYMITVPLALMLISMLVSLLI